jgi:hypothetical protein
MRYVLAVAVLMAGVASGQELPEDTNEIKALTVEQAQALAQHKGGLSLDGLTTLSDEAAAALRANPNTVLPDKFERKQ